MIRGNSLSGSSGDIAAYTSKDDYFSEGGQVVGQWQGQGAESAGLVGDVKTEDFRQVLEGKAPNGQQLGTVREGELEHRPGWDFTVSAPKSVSEVALVAGDRQAIEAHEAGVRAAIAVLERGAEYRERVNGEVVHRKGDGIVAATFNHSTSRAGDPQLHTHVIVANMVQAADGTWRSLETREMFALQQAADMAYKAEVASCLTRAGYELDIDRKAGNFEVRDVPESLRELHSQRTEQIDRALQAQGLDRETASAAERDKASLDTRAEKVHEDPTAARERWQADAKAHGWDYEAHKREAIERAAGCEQRPADSVRVADHSVAFATQHLSERESRVTRADLETAAMGRAMGEATPAEIRAAVDRAVVDGTLVPREIDHGSNHPATAAFTTPQAIRDESRMLASEMRGRGALEGLMSCAEAQAVVIRAEAKAAAAGHNWNEGQRTAAIGALTSQNTVTGIQGYAGTAKTSTVLATLTQAAKDRGIEVKAMAPTGTAAQKLGNEIGAESSTVTKFLNDAAKPGNKDMGRGGVWIVDEASLLSTGQARALVELAEGRGAHLVVTGDVKQHEAVEAGGPFAQLQAAGMQSYVLGDILRQQNEELRGAVYSSVEGKAAEAFAKLETGGGQVIQIADADARHQQMAADYTALKPSERDNTIMVSSSRDGRDAITTNVREILVQKGELVGPAANVRGLDRVDMTKAQARHADNYQTGQVVQFAFNLRGAGLEAGKVYEVASTNKGTNHVMLKAEDGSLREWNPKQGGASHVSVAERMNVELRQGDKVALTGKLENGTNGMSGRVEAVNGRGAMVRLQNGEVVKMRDGDTLPVRHGYVHTTYAAQGQTCGKVMANMPATGKGAKASTDRAFYVSLSRGQVEAKIYTDDQAKLANRVSVRTAKTNALDRGAETTAAQRGKFEDRATMRGPSIAEARQRISAGLEKPQATLQHSGAKHGPSPSQVAERMGVNKAPNDAGHSKQEVAKATAEQSRAEPVRAPRIDEIRQQIEKPIERDAAGQAGREQAGDHGRSPGFTKAEMEWAEKEINYDREQGRSNTGYADNALDSVQAEKWNAERTAELTGAERDQGATTAEERQPVVERETTAERDASDLTKQEPVAEHHRDDIGADREVETARFERDAGPESSNAAAWSELDRERDQLAGHAERGAETTQERGDVDRMRPERELGDGREQGASEWRGEIPQERQGAEGEHQAERVDQSQPDRGDIDHAHAERQSVEGREQGAERGQENGRSVPERNAERDSGEAQRPEPQERIADECANDDRQADRADEQQRPEPEQPMQGRGDGERVDQERQSTANHVAGDVRGVDKAEPERDGEVNAGVDRQSNADREAPTVAREQGTHEQQHSDAEKGGREPPGVHGDQERQGANAEQGEPMKGNAGQVERAAGAEARGNGRDAGNTRGADQSRPSEQAGRESATDRAGGQMARDGGTERGIAPSRVAERMTASMVERAQTRSGETVNQVTRESGHAAATEDRGSSKGEDRERGEEGSRER